MLNVRLDLYGVVHLKNSMKERSYYLSTVYIYIYIIYDEDLWEDNYRLELIEVRMRWWRRSIEKDLSEIFEEDFFRQKVYSILYENDGKTEDTHLMFTALLL